MTPEKALKILKEGNNRFVEKNSKKQDLYTQIQQTKDAQNPFAVVLGCIDSRVPHEYIFDLGIGDIFSIRIAGNILNDDITGSLEFACDVIGSKHILVLGHTGCGAIEGAYQKVQLGKLTGLTEKIYPAIEAIHKNNSIVDKPDLDQIARKNVELVVDQIRKESSILDQLIQKKKISISGGIYDVQTGKVEFF